MERMRKQEENIRVFCRVCDYYQGDARQLACRQANPEMQRRFFLRRWCGVGCVGGQSAKYIKPSQIEINGIKYSRANENTLREALKTREGLEKFEIIR